MLQEWVLIPENKFTFDHFLSFLCSKDNGFLDKCLNLTHVHHCLATKEEHKMVSQKTLKNQSNGERNTKSMLCNDQCSLCIWTPKTLQCLEFEPLSCELMRDVHMLKCNNIKEFWNVLHEAEDQNYSIRVSKLVRHYWKTLNVIILPSKCHKTLTIGMPRKLKV